MFDILIGLLIAGSFYLIGQLELFRRKEEEIRRLRRQIKALERARIIAAVENQKLLNVIEDLEEEAERLSQPPPAGSPPAPPAEDLPPVKPGSEQDAPPP